MGLFRRKATDATAPKPEPSAGSEAGTDAADTDATAAAGATASGGEPQAGGDAAQDSTPKKRGPFDSGDVEGRGSRIDLGAVWLPGLPGMELRMEADRKSGKVTGASCTFQGSALQIQAFAAPRTAGIWDEIRAEIAQSVARQGGAVDEIPGPFGRELLARLPAKGPDGTSGFRPARFVGVDGPRWFLRGVITGRAAVDRGQARIVEAIFANVVVVRDEAARAPRDLLELTLPGKGVTPKVAGPQGAEPEVPGQTFDPLTRGPEITETR
ncbi:hypothetical protein GCM10025865_26730 [Paraoerskovia sediminicola]|uniref:DUF3710 domain-containing protein n=1 Tax=Paraoerskovia sediminicola TaxID=1138587 RepID=A0ABM8G5R4_9CELL|nr:DUF3710 domain-containing protein [Paraoerskovia sediminicola]BDZ43374.1 hypothetical protein GCM10025865_26730 [Paraoerskovia sediminicola]